MGFGLYILYIDIILPEEINNNDIAKVMYEMVDICRTNMIIDHESWHIEVHNSLEQNNGRPIPEWVIYPGDKEKWESDFFPSIQKWDYHQVSVSVDFIVRQNMYTLTFSAYVGEENPGFYNPKPKGKKRIYWGMSRVIWDSMPEEDKNKLRSYVKTISDKWNATFVFEENWEI